MANIRLGNTFYIDTQYTVAADELAVPDILVKSIVVTSTSTGATVTLSDSDKGIKGTFSIPTDDTTIVIDLSQNPWRFSTSIRPTVLTNCVVTVTVEQ